MKFLGASECVGLVERGVGFLDIGFRFFRLLMLLGDFCTAGGVAGFRLAVCFLGLLGVLSGEADGDA